MREVVDWRAPRSLGAGEPWRLGIVALRGELLEIVDLALRLGIEPGERSRIVVFDGPDGPVGLAVDAIETVVTVDDALLAPAPVGSGDAVAQIARVDSDLVVLLDPDVLLGPKPAAPPRRRSSARKRPAAD